MKQRFLFNIAMAMLVMAACTKTQDINRDYAIPTGKGAYPVSTNTLLDMSNNKTLGADSLAGGYSFKTELQYFSQDPVKEINLYSTVGTGARMPVSTTPYAAAYSNTKKLDTLLVSYTVASGLAKGTAIKLDYEILNLNGLNLIRTVTVRSK